MDRSDLEGSTPHLTPQKIQEIVTRAVNGRVDPNKVRVNLPAAILAALNTASAPREQYILDFNALNTLPKEHLDTYLNALESLLARRRRSFGVATIFIALLVIALAFGIFYANQTAQEQAQALARLSDKDATSAQVSGALHQLSDRTIAFDQLKQLKGDRLLKLFDRTVPKDPEALLSTIQLAVPLIHREGSVDLKLLGAALAGIDAQLVPNSELKQRALALRRALIEPLGEVGKPLGSWVDLGDFEMLIHEVTEAEYRQLVEGHNPGVPGEHPVTGVTWYEAYAYAAWVGAQLPTEAQWLFAAGGEGQIYPWGDELSCERARYAGCGGLGPVCEKTLGDSKQGLCDLAGSVWEWCRDWYSVPPKPGAVRGTERSVRGGTWDGGAASLKNKSRGFRAPNANLRDQGFRLVRDALHKQRGEGHDH